MGKLDRIAKKLLGKTGEPASEINAIESDHQLHGGQFDPAHPDAHERMHAL